LLFSLRLGLLFGGLLLFTALSPTADCTERGAIGSAFTGIIVSNLADQGANGRATYRTTGSGALSGLGCLLLCRLRLLGIGCLLIHNLERVTAGRRNSPLVTTGFVLRLLLCSLSF
jgi:hypothetical protein